VTVEGRVVGAIQHGLAILVGVRVGDTEAEAQWGVMQDRLIVVLKMSGRCTVRSIVAVLHAKRGSGLHVSVGYVQGVIAQAGGQAHSAWARVLQVVPLSGVVCLDEVFFKEMACQVLGIVIVDPLTGPILHLERCTERSKDAISTVLQHFNAAGFQAQIILCLTDMYEGYLKPIKTYFPGRASILLVPSQLLSYRRHGASGRTRLPASGRSVGCL
jgi:hypothetical protein